MSPVIARSVSDEAIPVEARRKQLRNLPFAKKIEIVEKMRVAQLSPHGRLPTSES